MNAPATFPVRPSEGQFLWTDEAIERLRSLADGGRSASQIASEMGTTRNSVIGKCVRNGLRLQGKCGNRSGRPTRPLALRPTVAPSRVGQGVRARSPRVKRYVEPTPAVEAFGLLTIEGLEEGVCKFPYGDPRDLETFRYCGVPVGKERYCGGHRRVMYAPRGTR